MKTKLFLAGLILVAATFITAAHNPADGKGSCNGSCNGTNKCAAFVDQNKNGICDTYENRIAGNGAKNGNCDGSGKGICKAKNTPGANQKGVCNNSGSCTKK